MSAFRKREVEGKARKKALELNPFHSVVNLHPISKINTHISFDRRYEIFCIFILAGLERVERALIFATHHPRNKSFGTLVPRSVDS
jgi:hypothetical protein